MVAIIGDFVSDEIRAEQIYERDILEFIRDRVLDPTRTVDQVALDVGANIGNHSLFLADLFERVIAFEPNPLTRSILNINREMNAAENVEIRPVGLSDRNMTATLEFNPINLGAATTFNLAGKAARSNHCTIELTIGDDAVERSARVGFLKVDVEGAEESVLRGLEQTLRKHRPVIMIEQWIDVIDAGTSPAVSFLQDLGYCCWEIQRSRLFRGQLGKIPTLLLGHIDYSLRRISRLDKREYPALIFTPPSYVFPQRS